jgi:hypothetical protein
VEVEPQGGKTGRLEFYLAMPQPQSGSSLPNKILNIST